jgi:hypothetical protein
MMRDVQSPAGRWLSRTLKRDLASISNAIPFDEGGGASLLKVLVIADLIVALDLRRVVEIGVYRGRLLLPLAKVMAALGRGEAIGVDPYSAEAAVQRDAHDVGFDLIAWAKAADWESLYAELQTKIAHFGLDEHCSLIRARSETAVSEFAAQSIDLLHIDGNHDRDAVVRDVELFVPKVRAGGVIVIDDVSWSSVRETFEDLRASYQLHLQLADGGNVWIAEDVPNDFAVFIKAPLAARP